MADPDPSTGEPWPAAVGENCANGANSTGQLPVDARFGAADVVGAEIGGTGADVQLGE